VLNAEDRARFEQLVLPHLDAAFNLAVWILSSRTDAEDVTQDAMLRAFRFFEGFPWRRRARVVAANRPQYLLHLVGEESPNEDDGPIR
jgi:DNA-directed RNA polymerase specialized sigma24 family protein